MYPLLPTMKGVTHQLLKSAMKELAEKCKDDNETLSDFFAYMVLLLDRVKTLNPLEKTRMKEVLNMHNNLWDQSPIIQRMKAASEAKALQNGIVSVVNARFPLLTDLARKKVVQVDDIDKLN